MGHVSNELARLYTYSVAMQSCQYGALSGYPSNNYQHEGDQTYLVPDYCVYLVQPCTQATWEKE